MKQILFILILFISAAVSGQVVDSTSIISRIDFFHEKNDTVKCIALIYQKGPVPMQVNAWVVNSPETGRWRSDNDNNPHYTNIVRWEKTGGGTASAFLAADKRTPIKEEDVWQYKIKCW